MKVPTMDEWVTKLAVLLPQLSFSLLWLPVLHPWLAATPAPMMPFLGTSVNFCFSSASLVGSLAVGGLKGVIFGAARHGARVGQGRLSAALAISTQPLPSCEYRHTHMVGTLRPIPWKGQGLILPILLANPKPPYASRGISLQQAWTPPRGNGRPAQTLEFFNRVAGSLP